MSAQLIRIGINFDPVIIMVYGAAMRVPPRIPSQLPKDAQYFSLAFARNHHLMRSGLHIFPYQYARLSLTTGCDSWGDEEEFVGRTFGELLEAEGFVREQRCLRTTRLASDYPVPVSL